MASSLPAAHRPALGNHRLPAGRSTGGSLIDVHFVDATHGWALETSGGAHASMHDTRSMGVGVDYLSAGDQRVLDQGIELLTTDDGGSHWRDSHLVTNMGGRSDSLNGVTAQFVDARHGWMVATYADEVNVFGTGDAGTRWAATTIHLPVGFGAYAEVDFISVSTGWIEVVGAGHSLPAELFRTEDGGATWSLVSSDVDAGMYGSTQTNVLPYGAGLRFADTSNGWLASPPPIGSGNRSLSYSWVFKSADGGRTWTHVALPLPSDVPAPAMDAYNPVLFGVSDIVIPVQVLSQGAHGEFRLYESRDGGTAWTLSQPLQGTADAVSVVSPSTAWVHIRDDSVIYETTDAGRSWTPIGSLKVVQEMEFISPADGWAITQPLGLIRTTDGGSKWTRLDPYIP